MDEVTLTDSAIKYFQESLKRDNTAIGIRVGVKPSGCSGLSYIINYAKDILADDKVFTESGIKLVIDTKSLEVLSGTVLDCVKSGLNEHIKFKNPNVDSECGCGESFNVKKDK